MANLTNPQSYLLRPGFTNPVFSRKLEGEEGYLDAKLATETLADHHSENFGLLSTSFATASGYEQLDPELRDKLGDASAIMQELSAEFALLSTVAEGALLDPDEALLGNYDLSIAKLLKKTETSTWDEADLEFLSRTTDGRYYIAIYEEHLGGNPEATAVWEEEFTFEVQRLHWHNISVEYQTRAAKIQELLIRTEDIQTAAENTELYFKILGYTKAFISFATSTNLVGAGKTAFFVGLSELGLTVPRDVKAAARFLISKVSVELAEQDYEAMVDAWANDTGTVAAPIVYDPDYLIGAIGSTLYVISVNDSQSSPLQILALDTLPEIDEVIVIASMFSDDIDWNPSVLGRLTVHSLDGNDSITIGLENVFRTNELEVFAGDGDDVIFARAHAAEIYSGDGRDQIFLSSGSFDLEGNLGAIVDGGAGNDYFSLYYDVAANVFGGSGTDTLDFSDNAIGLEQYQALPQNSGQPITAPTTTTYEGSGVHNFKPETLFGNDIRFEGVEYLQLTPNEDEFTETQIASGDLKRIEGGLGDDTFEIVDPLGRMFLGGFFPSFENGFKFSSPDDGEDTIEYTTDDGVEVTFEKGDGPESNRTAVLVSGSRGTDEIYSFEELILTNSADTIIIDDLSVLANFGDARQNPTLTVDGGTGEDTIAFGRDGVLFDPKKFKLDEGELTVSGAKFLNIEAVLDQTGKDTSLFVTDSEEEQEAANKVAVEALQLKASSSFSTDLFNNIGGAAFKNFGSAEKIIGGKGSNFIATGKSEKFVQVSGGEGDDIVALVGVERGIVSGSDGNDWVLTFGGEQAITVGGPGRDWIFNTSHRGHIYGDTIDGILLQEGEAPRSFAEHDRLDSSANSDNIWWWPSVTMWDPQKNDVLKLFGIPLVGGNTQLPILGFLGGTVSGISVNARQKLFFDYFMPFITYKVDSDNNRLLVGNIFSKIFGFFSQKDDVENNLRGVMAFNNFDEANAVYWGGAYWKPSDEGSFAGLFSYTTEFNTDLIGDMGMIFKVTHPSFGIIAMIPGFPGGLNRFIPMIDEILTYAGAATLLGKAAQWSSGKDPLIIDLDGDGIETLDISEGAFFDIDGDFFREQTSWLGSDDGFLALDKNANGIIDDISELFGEGEVSGFSELAAYDDNGDGVIDAADLVFGDLVVWRDLDADGETDEGELFTLEEIGIVTIAIGGNDLNVTTPQGVEITRSGQVTFDDGRISHAYDAIFEVNDTETRYLGEAGVPAWLTDSVVNSRGFGEVTDFSIAMSNDFDIMDMAIAASEGMTTAKLKTLREQAGDALGQWGLGQSLTRELTPVLTQTTDGITALVDRAIWVEDEIGGYWALKSGADILDAQGGVIARPDIADVMAQAAGTDQSWALEQMWSPSTRDQALEHREAAPYLGAVVDDRFVVSDYGIEQPDGSWQLASGTLIVDAQGATIAQPTVTDVTAMAAPEGLQWRVEELGFNHLGGIETQEIGVNFIDGVAVDYTVELTDRHGTFHVWARNLDRALELQDKFGTPRDFNLRNYEIDFDTLDEVGSSDDSTYRVEVMTPAQFNFATALIGMEFEPAVLAGTIDEATGFIDYSINGDVPAWQADETRRGSIDIMIDLLDVVMEQWILVSRGFAARMALQGGLSDYAVDIGYDLASDSFQSTGDRELAPMFEAIFADAPAGYEAAQDYLADWNEVLWQIYPDYQMDGTDNLFGGTVAIDQKFILQMVIPAYEKYPLDVDLPAIMHALSANPDLLIQHDETAIEVLGDRGVDFIYLSGGDQIYKGGDGADVYFVGADWGTDFIEDVDFGAADELRFTSVKSDEVVATRDGQDLILMKDGAPDVLRVENHFLGELNPAFGNDSEDTRMTSIVFADGVVWGRVEIAAAVSRPQDSDQVIVGSGDLDVLDGGLGNDVLRGGAGGDIYFFARGYGQDVISEDNSAASNPLVAGIDFLQFIGEDLSADDLYLQRFGEGVDLFITLKDAEGNLTDDQITVEKQFDGLRLNLSGFLADNVDESLELDYIAPNLIERFLFEDGSSLDFGEMSQRVLENAKTDGSDIIYGFLDADTLDGGAGDDLLVGREGGDTYLFSRDYGLDEIVDGDNSVKLFGSPTDTLKFTDDLRWTDFDFLREGDTDNLTLQVAGTTDGVVLTEYLKVYPFLGFINLLEQIEFGDGTNWHYTQLLQHYVNISKTEGDDAVYGFITSDSLDGGLGDDTLEGQGGDDTYVLRVGDGSDQIFDAGGSVDRVQLQGIALADVNFSRTGLDLILTHRTTGDVITFTNQYERNGAQGNAIEVFEFSDQVIDYTQINPEDIDRVGTAGADMLEGSNFAETLDGLAGNDTLMGGSDGDTYRFDIGYGQDVIIDVQQAAAWDGRNGPEAETGDRISFGGSVTRDIVEFAKDGDDLLITLIGFPDTLRVRNQFRDVTDGVEYFDFVNDPTLFISDVEELLQITGGNRGDNRIEGIPDQDNVLDGRQGDDTLVGGSERDTYSFGIDYDFDQIEETEDAGGILDRVIMGNGVRSEDLILRRSGEDLLIDLGNGADVLRIVKGLTTNTVEEFLFADGSTLTSEGIRTQMLLGSDGNDQLLGFDNRADVLDGGAGSDALIGGTGDDTYHFGYNGGQDEIIDTGGIDTLEFGAGIAPGNLVFSEANGDLLIEMRDTGDSIVIIDGLRDGGIVDRFVFESGTILGMSDIRGQLFNAAPTEGSNVYDGTTLDPVWAITPGIGADKVIMGADTRVVFESGDGMDVYVMPTGTLGDARIELLDYAVADVVVRSVGYQGADLALDFPETGDQIILAGAKFVSQTPVIQFADGTEWTKADLARAQAISQATEYDNVITGSDFDDTIEGGTGDDDIAGGAGDDVYVFTRGDGKDIIADDAGSADVVEIYGYTPEDVTVTRPDPTRDELFVQFADTDDQLLLRYENGEGVDLLRFSDGTSWTKDQMFVQTVAQGTSFDDTLVGSDTGDVLNGEGGNDRLEGMLGNDTYVVDFAAGEDVIVDTGGIDNLLLGEALPSQVTLSRTQDDLRLDLPGAGSVTILGQMSDADARVEEIEFSDGTSWNFAYMSQLVDQTARATGGTIYGGREFNTYIHTQGDGSYSIEDEDSFFQQSGRLDKLEFRDTASDGLTFVRVGNDIELRINNGETLTLNRFYESVDFQIETIQFTDLTLDYAGVLNRVVDDAKATGFVRGSRAFETYTHTQGDGSYTIEDKDNFYLLSGRLDQLVFTDTASDQLTMLHEGDDLVLRLDNGEVITISKFYLNDDYEIETFVFTDQTLDLGQIFNRVVSDAKATGFVKGSGAYEVYTHTQGDGSYAVEDYDNHNLASSRLDKMMFTDVARADIKVQINNNDVIIILPNDETVTINRGGERYYVIEEIEFLGGDTVSSTALWEDAFINGSELDDNLIGRNAADTYRGEGGNDTIDGGSGNDTIFGGAGDDLLLTGGGLDEFHGEAGFDTLDFRAENTTRDVDLAAQTITLANGSVETATGIEGVLSGRRDDILRGDDAVNLLDGGLGDDTLEGRDGDDLYVISTFDDHDVIADLGANSVADEVRFEGLAAGASMLMQNGDDLLVNFAAGGSLTVLGQFGSNPDAVIESFAWAGGTTLDAAGIRARVAQGYATATGVVNGTNGADAFVHSSGDGFYVLQDVNDGGGIVDTLTLNGFTSGEVQFARTGDDLRLNLDNGEYVIVDDQFDTGNAVGIEQINFDDGTLDDSAFGARVLNDMKFLGAVVGTSNQETYSHAKGDGSYTIQDIEINPVQTDRLVFTDVTSSEATFSRVGTNLRITLDNGEQITVLRHFDNRKWDQIEEITFTDQTLDLSAIRLRTVANMKPSGAVVGSIEADTYYHTKGDGSYTIEDIEINPVQTDRLVFTDANSSEATFSHVGKSLRITLDNGEQITVLRHFDNRKWDQIEEITFGDETLTIPQIRQRTISDMKASGIVVGSVEAETYFHTKGDGSYTIEDIEVNPTETDQLTFVDMVSEDAFFGRVGDNLVITVGNGEAITVLKQFSSTGWDEIEVFNFSDGVSVLDADLDARIAIDQARNRILIEGTEVEDRLVGTDEADLIVGLEGDDQLSGGLGNDDYRFTKGDGQDVITDAGDGADRIEVVGYDLDEISFARNGRGSDDLVITFGDEGDRITITDGTLSDAANRIETLHLIDSDQTLTISEILQQIPLGKPTPGDDIIIGTNSANVLSGGTGNDRLEGRGGNDDYIFANGDGDDRIVDLSFSINDRLLLSDYNVEDIVWIARTGADGADMVIRFVGDRDRVTLEHVLGANARGVDTIAFADGTEWGRDMMRAVTLLSSQTISDDLIVGFDGGDILAGGPGDDRLQGGEGADLYQISRGNGFDEVLDGGTDETDIDRIEFTHFVSSEVSVRRLFKGSDTVVLSFVTSDDTLTIFNALSSDGTAVEEIAFSDGVVWTPADLLSKIDNTAPEAISDGYFTATQDSPLIIGAQELLRNDFDPDGQTLSIIAVDGGADGVAELDANGNVVFTGNEGFFGVTQLTYTISDGQNGIASTTVNLRVRPQAEARDDAGFEVNEDGTITIRAERLLSNDLDGDRMLVGEVFDPVNGTVSIASNGDITFTPTADFNGLARFSYAANTPEGGRAEAVVTIDVAPVNDAPGAVDDGGFQTIEDQPFQIFTGDLVDNDVDIDGDLLSVVDVQGNADVTVELTDDGYVLVTPAAFFWGDGFFDYTIEDAEGIQSTGRVAYYVEPVNNAPETTNDSFVTDEDQPVLIDVEDLLANDLDRDGDAMEVVGAFSGTNGSVALQNNGTILFTPSGDFHGTANFTYRVDDGQGGLSTGEVSIEVASINDDPEASNDWYGNLPNLIGTEDVVLEILIADLLANDTDTEDSVVEFIDVFGAVDGEVEVSSEGVIQYTPDPDFWGETTFYYGVRDSEGAVDDAAVTIWFENVGDAPPVAVTDVIEVFEDVPRVILFETLLSNDYDIDRDPLEVLGWLSRVGFFDLNGTVTYLEDDTGFLFTPDLNKTQSDGFVYAVTDNADGTSYGFVDIQMIAVPDDPTAVNDEAGTAPLNVPLVIRIADLLANDFDVDEEEFSFASLDSTSDGVGTVYLDEFIVVRFDAGFSDLVDLQYSIMDPTGLTDAGFITSSVADIYSGSQMGTEARDLLIGNELAETISGAAGDDDIFGEAGSDVLLGGTGNDLIDAGAGDDIINGGDGGDTIDGGTGFDYVTFEGSNIGVRADLMSRLGQGGFAGGDLYSNVEGLIGTDYADSLYGDEGLNVLVGGGSADILSGRAGGDLLQGGTGNDTLEGGAGADTLEGGEGSDTADYFMSAEAVQVSLEANTGVGGDAQGDSFDSIENVVGSDFADLLEGDANDNTLQGGRESDTLIGGAGADLLIGGRGADLMQGGAGVDTADYRLSLAGVTVNMANGASGGGDAEGDTFDSIEIVQGSYHNDDITGNAEDNIIRGGVGADTMDGAAGFDILDYSTETAGIAIDLAAGTGSAGVATGDVVTGFEQVTGTNFGDRITGSDADEVLDGGRGDDVMAGGLGSDSYTFGFGDGTDQATELGALGDTDRVLLAADVEVRDVSLVREGDDLLIELEQEVGIITDTLRITNHFVGPEQGIEEVVFGNGTTWDRDQMDALTRLGRFNAGDDIYLFGVEDEEITFDVSRLLENDVTEGAEDLTIIQVAAVSGGTPTLHSDGRVTFLGDQDFNGDAFFDYVVRDPFGRESTARVEVNLAPVNDAPVAGDDGVIVGTEDVVLFIAFEDLLANDSDIDGDVLSITELGPLLDIDGNPLNSTTNFELTHGKGELVAGGIEFTSTPDYFGFAGFTYTVSDPDGLTDKAEVELYFSPINDAPRSQGDSLTLRLDKVNRIELSEILNNDFDPEGDDFTFEGVHSVQGGALELLSEEILVSGGGDTGQPAVYRTQEYLEFVGDALGAASFQYDLIDEHGAANTITAGITVIPLNDPPRARDDSGFETLEDQVLIIEASELLANDLDENGDVLSITSVERFPQNGRVELLEDGRIAFTPRSDFNGEAGFEYTITDGEYLSSAFVAITILPDNDAPVLRDDVTSWFEDQELTLVPGEFFGNDFDADGDVIFLDRVELIGALDTNFLIEARGVTFPEQETLPEWLTYDEDTQILQGEMPEDFVGELVLNTTASIGRWYGLAEDVLAANEVPDTFNPDGSPVYVEGTQAFIDNRLRLEDDSVTQSHVVTIAPDDIYLLSRGIDLSAVFEVGLAPRDPFETSLQMADVLCSDVTATLELADGSAAPAWLTIDAQALVVTGDWPAGEDDPLALNIVLSLPTEDGALTHVQAAQLTPEMTSDLAAEGVALATNAPVLDLRTSEVTVSAAGANGHPLPAWIDFDADTLQLVNTEVPPAVDEGLLRLRVSFTPDLPAGITLPDDFHLSADGSFDLEFVIDPAVGIDPAINTMLQSQGFFAAQGLLALPELDPATLSAAKENLVDLPDWLSFDAETLSFSGLPPIDYVGGLPIRIDVEAQDGLPAFSIIHELPVDIGFQPGTGEGFGGSYDDEYITLNAPEDFNGPFAVRYWAEDTKEAVSEEPAVIVINLEAQPELPEALADTFEGFEDVPLTFSLADMLVNDFDDDDDAIRVISVEDPASGTLTINLPEQTFAAPAQLVVPAGSSVVVSGVGGMALPDYVTAVDAATGTLTATVPLDVFAELDLVWTVVSDADGSVIQSTTSAVTFDGNAGVTLTYLGEPEASGLFEFDYTITDDAQGTATSTVSINLIGVNDPPSANADTLQSLEDEALIIDVQTLLANDNDPDGDALSFVSAFDAMNGSMQMVNGDVVFTPDANFFGEASFSYEITDNTDGNATATVTIEVEENNARPTAVTDIYQAVEDMPITVWPADLLANDFDLNTEDTISFIRIFNASDDLGNASERPDGSWLLTPNADINGVVAFAYQINDGRLSDSGVIEVNFAPVNDAPTARDDNGFTLDEDTPFTIRVADLLANDTDIEGDAFDLVAAFDGDNGTVQLLGDVVEFTPRTDHFGNAGFTYTVEDVHGATSQAFVSLTVLPQNDLPVAVNDTGLSVQEDSSLIILSEDLLANDSDPDGDPLSIQSFDASERLSANGDGTFTFTPLPDEIGTLRLTYTLSDGQGGTDRAFVDIDVINTPDAPTGVDDTLTFDEDQVFSIPAANLTGNDIDPDGDALAITGIVSTTGVSVSIDPFVGLEITPDQDRYGDASFVYTVEDSTDLQSTARVAITLRAVNDAPVIDPLADIVSAEDTLLEASLPAGAIRDVDGDSLLITPTMADGSVLPAWLSYDNTARSFLGAPPLDFNGVLDLTITVDDGTTSTAAPLRIVIDPVNDAPVAQDDIWDAGQDTTIVIPLTHLLTNDSDVDGDALSISSAVGGAGYTATLDNSGNLVIERDVDFEGVIDVDYTLSDGLLSDEGTLNVSVIAANQAPIVTNPGTLQSAEDEGIDITLPVGTVSDPDGDTLALTLTRAGGTALPAWLSFDEATQGLTGTPPANFNGLIALALTADDGRLSASTEFELEITAVNDIPILLAPLSGRTATEDTPFDIALQRSLFEDVDGDVLSFALTGADGTDLPEWIAFDPALFAITGQAPQDFEGEVTLQVTASDGIASISDDFVLTIQGLNDAPVLINPLPDYVTDNDGATLATGTAFVIDAPTDSFSDPDGDPLAFAAQLSDGSALPAWLSFDGVTFSGTAPRSEAGVLELQLRATDGVEEVSDIFTMTFEERNSPPVVTEVSISATVPNAVYFNISDLVAAASDPDGDTLSITSFSDASNGSVTAENDVATYLADYDFEGEDSFTYEITDGTDTTTGTVTVTVDNPYIGDDAGNNQDVEIGGDGTDAFFGGRGADLLSGGGGADLLFGGRGADVVLGGDGSDLLSGGSGRDTINGGDGSDVIFGGRGQDDITGGAGNDLIFGGRGNDTFNFSSGDGSDVIVGWDNSRARRNSFIAGDQLRLNVDGIDSFDDLLGVASQTGGGVLFDFGNGDEIFLSGTRLAALDSDQFTFY